MQVLYLPIDKDNYIVEKTNVNRFIGRKVANQIVAAKTFYSMIGALYNIRLSELEIGVMAYTAIYGTISTPPARQAFIEDYKTTKASLNNYISKLQKRNLLYKDEHLKIRIIPDISIDFKSGSYTFKVNINVIEP